MAFFRIFELPSLWLFQGFLSFFFKKKNNFKQAWAAKYELAKYEQLIDNCAELDFLSIEFFFQPQ